MRFKLKKKMNLKKKIMITDYIYQNIFYLRVKNVSTDTVALAIAPNVHRFNILGKKDTMLSIKI